MTTPAQSLHTAADDLDATLTSLARDTAAQEDQVLGLAGQLRRLEARVKALESVPSVPTPDTPVVDPVTPSQPAPPPTKKRRFGCNIGYKVNKSWSPDKPDDPRYDDIIAPFGGFRFMDWWRTNDDLNTSGRISQEQKDLLDRQIDLCNRHKADMYLNLLFHDSPKTIQYKVGRMRDRLDAGLVRYVEWANEWWNGGDRGGTNVYKELQRISGEKNYWENNIMYDAVAVILQNTFSEIKSADSSCVTVMGCLTSNPGVARKVEHRLNLRPDAHGLTFYFGAGLGGTPNPDTTVNDILSSSNRKITNKEIPRMQAHAKYSKSIGRRIVGYEGLSHFTIKPQLHESHKKVWQAMNQANRDPRIVPLCERIAKAAEDAGYENLFIFNLVTLYDAWGSWGLGESLDTIKQAPKYKWATGT